MDVQSIVGAALCATMLAGSAWGQDVPVPSLTQENGRHVLLVDGRPFIQEYDSRPAKNVFEWIYKTLTGKQIS